MLSCHLCLLISCECVVFRILSFDCSYCLLVWYLYIFSSTNQFMEIQKKRIILHIYPGRNVVFFLINAFRRIISCKVFQIVLFCFFLIVDDFYLSNCRIVKNYMKLNHDLYQNWNTWRTT